MHLYQKRAILDGAETEIFKLLSYGATLEQWADWLRAPLEHAAARGNLDVVNKLLEAGASGRAGWRGCRGRTLLDAAAVGGNPDVASALLRAGCRPDVNVVSALSRRSALHVAVTCGHDAVAKTLIVAGVDVDLIDPHVGVGPLHIAARWGHKQLVRDLLIGEAPPVARDKQKCTPLHVATRFGRENIVPELLVPNRADKDAGDLIGCTPLMIACKEGHLSTVRTLLAAGADPALRDMIDISALDSAASRGHISIVAALLEHGVDVNAADGFDCTALDQTAKCDLVPAVEMLIDAGFPVDAKTTTGTTPLVEAAMFGKAKSMLALLRRGAKVDGPGYEQGTPLHAVVCMLKRNGAAAACADLLLRWGASETAVDQDGHTPADRLRLDNSIWYSADDKERVRVLLTRAPTDRAWRRRCWFVMLRSRADKERAAHRGGYVSGGGAEGGPSGPGGDDRGGNKKIERTGDCAAGGGARDGRGGHTKGEEKAVDGGGDCRGVVSMLVALESEGVFRNVLGFL